MMSNPEDSPLVDVSFAIEINVIEEFKSAAGLGKIMGKSFWLQLFCILFGVDRHDYTTAEATLGCSPPSISCK